MRALRGWKLPVLLVAILLVAFAAYALWQVMRTSTDLASAADDARSLQQAVESGDDAAAERALDSLRANAGAAADRTDGPLWSVLTWTPVLGDDLDGVRTVSAVLDDLATSGIEPLVETSRQLNSLRPVDGRVDLDVVAGLQEPVATGRDAFATASSDLDEHDPGGFVGVLGDKYREVATEVDRAARLLDSADRAVQVMPTMLGADGPRNYLLVFQNNAEVRAGGGLPGLAALVTTNDGAIDLSRQVPGNSFGELDEPVLPLTEAEDDIWDEQLGTFFLDANFTPDFPRSAELWQARWEQEYESVDGVIAVDPVTLSYVLGAIGPVEVEGDPTLTEENAVDELLHQVYLRYEDPADQDAYFQAAASTIFDRVASGGGDARQVITALSRGTNEGRLKVHSFDESEQAVLTGTRIAGELKDDPGGADPQLGVYLNDTTGAKMSYFLRHEVHVTANSCTSDGVQRLSGRAYLLSDAPADAASLPTYITGGGNFGVEPGGQLVTINIVGPVGGEFDNMTYNDEPLLTSPIIDLDGRPVLTAVTLLEPGQTYDLKWTVTTGEGQTGDVAVDSTAGVEPGTASSTARSAC
ncbi:DUF4012 domain-containing protein [Nocardioides zeae]|uniref:DUF4012 domain-containing protein n=1 Tax=Nocardioides imazamoxiresistens TaxID=3231893 RepID=A0ABU3PWD4_9ACTN|nr:DUF4012 domain-containing protein [Nocardioides zeae]MDT9593543.1 DUF4012 domain-containing protein [Nocardioides zeae]